uniref:Protein phosphatase 1 regulatory subunit 15B-like n=1 Tax=Stegastes partitus TaxID=144197 RepID=A0A3B4ZTM9_9TELE
MFRNMNSEGPLSGGHSPSSSPGHGVSSSGLVSQESSWIRLLSRPALALLQRILPGPRLRSPALAEKGSGWLTADLNSSFVSEETEFLRQLDDMMPHPPPLAYLRCDPGGGLLEPRPGGAAGWMAAHSLRESGLQSEAELDLNLCHHTQLGYFSYVRTLMNQVLLSSPEMKPPGGSDWASEAGSPPASSGAGRGWWGSLWGAEEGSQRGLLSELPWAEDGLAPGRLCPPPAETKVFVPSRDWALGEGSGPGRHKGPLAHKAGLHTVQNTEGSGPDRHLSIRTQLNSFGAACSEVTVLTREQDHGYCSLEEEQLKARSPESSAGMEEVCESGEVEEPQTAQQGGPGGASGPSPPQCQNKAIAFIMGCPCSDDDSSQSDSGGDDGFDSEGSSDLSDSTDDDSDSEVDLESDRLWSSLCQSQDPYNPQNFTAQLQSGSGPRSIPTSTPPSSAQSSPASSPTASPLLPASPPSGLDVWDDSASASETDEAESLRLWSSFSSSDPYSPFNFQAPLRTRGPADAPHGAQVWGKEASSTPRVPPHHRPASEKETFEDTMFELLGSVRFCDHVEEFFTSGGEDEDRRGPWEEFARDRCRFLRRCQEVEQSIAYVLQPQHRRKARRVLLTASLLYSGVCLD